MANKDKPAAAIPAIELDKKYLPFLIPATEAIATHGPYAKLTVTGNNAVLDLADGLSKNIELANARDYSAGGLVTFDQQGQAVGYIPNPEPRASRRTTGQSSNAMRPDL